MGSSKPLRPAMNGATLAVKSPTRVHKRPAPVASGALTGAIPRSCRKCGTATPASAKGPRRNFRKYAVPSSATIR